MAAVSETEVGTVKKQQSGDVVSADSLSLKDYDMWALGITIVIGGQYFAWNAGLSAGFGSFAIATFLIASGYGCLILCIAELSSGLPFAGGSYGLARVTAGIYPGFLVACFDSIESIIYVATSAVSIGHMLGYMFGTGRNWEPLYWLLFYGSALAIHCWGGLTFWRINMAMALVSFLIVLLYIFGSAHWGNFDSYAKLEDESGHSAWFHGGGSEFMRVLPIPSWFFVGVESINLACQDIKEPKKNIPRGYLSCIATLLVTCLGIFLVAVSLPPGIEELEGELNPLNAGFRLLLKCSDQVATLLAMPALYATAFGFMFCYGRQVRSMGNSGLVPHYLGESHPVRKTPVRALIAGSVIGLCVCGIVFFFPLVGAELFNICMLGAFSAYVAQFVSYMVFNTLLSNIKREFKSPLGIVGAIYGSCVFITAFIAIALFQNNYIAITVFTVYIFAVTVYYYTVVKHRQFFSDEEKQVLMAAHVVKNNMSKQRKRRGGSSETMCDKFNYWLIQKLPSKRTGQSKRGGWGKSTNSKWSSNNNSKADSVASVQPTDYTADSAAPLVSNDGRVVDDAVTAFDEGATTTTAAAGATTTEAKKVKSVEEEGALGSSVDNSVDGDEFAESSSSGNDSSVLNAKESLTGVGNDYGHRYSASGRRVITLRGESIEELTEVNGYTSSDLRLPPELENETDAMEGLRRFGRAASMTLRQFSSISRHASVLPEGEEERGDIIDEDKVDCKDGVCKPMEMA